LYAGVICLESDGEPRAAPVSRRRARAELVIEALLLLIAPVTVALVEVFEKHADRGGLPATPLPEDES
jgi:hypothetical protein